MVSKVSMFLTIGFVFNLTDVSNFRPFSASETSSTDGRFHIDVSQNWITLLILV